MDLISKSPGLYYILEMIFTDLDQNDLQKCQEVNQTWHDILTSLTWYKKLMQRTPTRSFQIWDLSERKKSEWLKLFDKLIQNCNSNQTLYMRHFFQKLQINHAAKLGQDGMENDAILEKFRGRN